MPEPPLWLKTLGCLGHFCLLALFCLWLVLMVHIFVQGVLWVFTE